MKKFLALSISTLATLCVFQAFAADLTMRKETAMAPPPPLWAGFHVGVNAGGVWNNSSNINFASVPVGPYAADIAIFPLAAASLNGDIASGGGGGFIGGGQLGYDWQFALRGAGLLAGVETDIMGIAGNGGGANRTIAYPGLQPGSYLLNSLSGTANLDYVGTVRGRLGFLATPTLLVYGTGGLAYGNVSFSNASYQTYYLSMIGQHTYNAFGNISGSGARVGYAAGAGVEWMFMPNWSAKAEYIYYDLGHISASGAMTTVRAPFMPASSPASVWMAQTIHSHISGNIARAGVNYHFNWGAAPVTGAY